jgi:peptide/nickel transport system ATP-binding protein
MRRVPEFGCCRSRSGDRCSSLLLITHNIGAVEYIADEVAVMQAGRIVEQGVSDQVLRSPAHAYTRTLLAAVPRLQVAA